jgi:hypothetical protein
VSGFFASGHAADLILVILSLELIWLLAMRKLAAFDAVGLIVPGLLIVIGLRAALTGAAWPWVAAPLALALPFHLVDLARRLRAGRRA